MLQKRHCLSLRLNSRVSTTEQRFQVRARTYLVRLVCFWKRGNALSSHNERQRVSVEPDVNQDIHTIEAETMDSLAGSRWRRGCVIITSFLLALGLCSALFLLTGYRLAQNVWQAPETPTETATLSTPTLVALATPFLPTSTSRPPVIIVTPTGELVTVALNQVLPTAPPAALPTVAPAPTEPPPPPSPTPTTDPAIKPHAEVLTGTVLLRTGPGYQFPIVAAWGAGIPLDIRSQSLDAQWVQVCCIQTESAPEGALWLPRTGEPITITGAANLRLYATPISVPTAEIRLTPFARARGPELYQNDNNRLTIEVKVYVGQSPAEEFLPGYLLAVEFHAPNTTVIEKRLNQNSQQVSSDQFSPGYTGDPVNYKYEYSAPLGEGTWRFWLTNAEGYNLWLQDDPAYKLFQLSDEITVPIDGASKVRQIFVAWIRVG